MIAAGSRVRIPTVDGLPETPYETSDTVMRLPTLPRSMIIVGAGYVAAEFAHVFSAYGTAVTVVARSAALLRHEDAEISVPVHPSRWASGSSCACGTCSAPPGAPRRAASASTSRVRRARRP